MQNNNFYANRTRNGWYEILDDNDEKVADYRKGELEVNKDYPLTSEMQRELMFLILNLD